ncbi:hypothetical protein LZ30DRAFT_783199 [Colletotrichum cereale]|nr:hypothetical protein LZ30DRAFT_783199 [Colletotrichum cereale]
MSLTPGEGDQDIGMRTKLRRPDFNPKTEDQGIATHVFAAFNPDLKASRLVEFNGRFFSNCRLADQYNEEVYPWAVNKIDADQLWKLSEKTVGEDFSYY